MTESNTGTGNIQDDPGYNVKNKKVFKNRNKLLKYVKAMKKLTEQIPVVKAEINSIASYWVVCVGLHAESHLTLYSSMDCSPPISSALGIFQARIPE